jgi:2-polyprenyl-3-methyl-5-hydroxy-6-metoxy-1,4-benzoquinol methylase
MRFQFGKNWQRYIETSLSEEKITQSASHLKSFLRVENLRGKTFLDVGSGSGIHSLAALRLGADRIFSFDYDENSVSATARLRGNAGSPVNWTVEQGSVLDEHYMQKLDKFDVVYSWGVLHHTGDMWSAVRNASIPLRPGGVFYIALYSPEIYVSPPSHNWLDVKQQYNAASNFRKKKMELSYVWRTVVRPTLRSGRNPFSIMREYGDRGMTFWTDVRDWLGGYPMDFAGFRDTILFCERTLNLQLVNSKAGEGNTEYLFTKITENEQWREIQNERQHVVLSDRYASAGRYLYVANCAEFKDAADTGTLPRRSRLMLYEDKIPLGLAHSSHEDIRTYGLGRFSHWEDHLYFSATDCTNPNFNGRRYSYVAEY